jgi:hypothetical protein
MFEFNFGLFADRMLPSFLRKPFHSAWLKVLLSPLTSINSNFASTASERLQGLRFSAQTLAFEARLNSRFSVNSFKIINNQIVLQNFLVQPSVLSFSTPLILPFAYGFNSPLCFPVAISVADETMFTVEAPASLTAQETQIRAEINRYKHAGYTYTLTFV